MIKRLLSILVCASPIAVFALPVNNPADPKLYNSGIIFYAYEFPFFNACSFLNFRAGYYGDFVFERSLNQGDRHGGGGTIEKTTLATNAAYFVLNICDRVDIFSTVGCTHIHLCTNANVFSGALFSDALDIDFKSRFSWSVGARAVILDCDPFFFGIEGAYFNTRPEFNELVDYDTGTKIYFSGQNTRYHEWQVGFGLSYRIGCDCLPVDFISYAAVKWSQVHFRNDSDTLVTTFNQTFRIDDFNSNKHCGFALGVSMRFAGLSSITVEGRWFDEEAVAVIGQFRF